MRARLRPVPLLNLPDCCYATEDENGAITPAITTPAAVIPERTGWRAVPGNVWCWTHMTWEVARYDGDR